jgi:hypothetical protein
MHKVVLASPFARDKALRLVGGAPEGWVVSLAEPRRTVSQNDKMWALLTDISLAKPQGRFHTPEIWKDIFLDSIGIKADWVPSLDGSTAVNTARRSSKLTKAQMSDLIESIYAYGSEHGVRWSDPKEGVAAA